MLRLAGVLVVLLGLAASAAAAPGLPDFRIGSIAPEGTAWSGQACMGVLADRLKQTGVRPRLFLGAALGDERTQLQLLRDGKLHAYAGGMIALSHFVPELSVFSLPFLFESEAEVDAVIRSPAGEEARKLARAAGFEVVFIVEVGWRSFAGRRPFRKPADLAGLTVRAWENPMHLEMWRLLGAKPRALAVTETLPALEAGLIQAMDQSPVFLFATSWYQKTSHYTLSRHIYEPAVVVASRAALREFPPAVARLLHDMRRSLEPPCIDDIRTEGKSVMREMAREGVTLVELTPAEREEFRRRLEAPVRESFRKTTTPAGRALLVSIEAALAAHRQKIGVTGRSR